MRDRAVERTNTKKMKRGLSATGAALIASAWVASTRLVFAACPSGLQLFNPLDPDCKGGVTFVGVADNIAGFLFYDIAPPLCAVMVLLGAFEIMTAAGDPEKFANGKKTLVYATVVFVVALLAGGVTSVIRSVVTGS